MILLRTVLAILLFPSIAGCSAVVQKLDFSCSSEDDCDALNAAEHLGENACLRYRCIDSRKGCERRPRDEDKDEYADQIACADAGLPGPLDCDDEAELTYPDAGETCDEHDNDCDGWIDEGILSEATLEMPLVTPLENVPGQADLKLSMLRGDAAWLALTARTGNQVMTRLLAPRIPEQQAALMDDDTMTCNGGCKMWEVAVASSEELLLAVGVSALGCSAGQLRVGVTDGARTNALRWDGVCPDCAPTLNAATSNLSLGVDRGGDRTCSMSGEQAGASAPSVGLLRNAEGEAQEALALWRAGPANGPPLPLVGLPLRFVRSPPSQGRVVSVQGEPAASSDAFEARTWGSEPALIQPWRGRRQSGYLVAYDSAEGVELAFVPASVSPGFSEVHGLSIPAAGGARSVALAFIAPDQETAPPASELALAFRSDQADGLLLARVRFDPAADPPLTLLSCGRLYEQHQLLEGPTLLYHAPGFAEESAARGGGFFLTWVERDGPSRRLMGARLDEAAAATDTSCRESVSRVLNEEPFPLWRDPSIAHAFTLADADADQPPRYAFITKEAEQRLNIGSLRCRRE